MTCSNARHVVETLKGNAGLSAASSAAISKYLRHSVGVASKHYDFGAVETSRRERKEVYDLVIVGERNSVDMETESNSTTEPDSENAEMTDSQRTKKLFEHVKREKPVTISAKLPTLDDVRAIIAQEFKNADDIWQHCAPKKVTSRLVFYWHTAIYRLF